MTRELPDKFRAWLNRVDARVTYDKRCKLAPVEGWLSLWEDCHTEEGAIRFYLKQQQEQRR